MAREGERAFYYGSSRIEEAGNNIRQLEGRVAQLEHEVAQLKADLAKVWAHIAKTEHIAGIRTVHRSDA